VRHIEALQSAEELREFALLLYDQASLTEDGEVGNPADFSRRLNALLVRLVTPASERSS
jgi:HSP90 family molecular chaperone